MTDGAVLERRVSRILTRMGYQWTRAGGRILHLPGGRFIAQRQDFFGCLDFMALHPEQERVLGIQVTTQGNAGHRRHKIERALPRYGSPMSRGLEIQLWVWAKWSGRRGWGFRTERFLGANGDAVKLRTNRSVRWVTQGFMPSPGRAAHSKGTKDSGEAVRA